MRVLIGIVAVGVTAQPCLAQTLREAVPQVSVREARAVVNDGISSSLVLLPGHAVTVTLDQPFSALIVGNPDLVDALAQTDRTFILQANTKSTGDTNIIASSNVGKQIHNLHVRVAPAVEGGGVRVHAGSPRGRWMIHDFAGYTCSDSYCVRLPKGKERIREPAVPNIVFAPTTNVGTPPQASE